VNADWNKKKDNAHASEKSEILNFEKSKNEPTAYISKHLLAAKIITKSMNRIKVLMYLK
jgi:hypothetical protein